MNAPVRASPPNGEFGGVVLRSLVTAGATLKPGTEISAEFVASWPIANRRALSESGTVRWHPFSKSDNVEAVGKVGRHLAHRGGGRFDVIEGHIINDEPLTREEAEALINEVN